MLELMFFYFVYQYKFYLLNTMFINLFILTYFYYNFFDINVCNIFIYTQSSLVDKPLVLITSKN
jgi:hypothetical protein